MAHPIVYVSVQSTGIRGDVGQRARCADSGRSSDERNRRWASRCRRPIPEPGAILGTGLAALSQVVFDVCSGKIGLICEFVR